MKSCFGFHNAKFGKRGCKNTGTGVDGEDAGAGLIDETTNLFHCGLDLLIGLCENCCQNTRIETQQSLIGDGQVLSIDKHRRRDVRTFVGSTFSRCRKRFS